VGTLKNKWSDTEPSQIENNKNPNSNKEDVKNKLSKGIDDVVLILD
jgi:hypothetical protein